MVKKQYADSFSPFERKSKEMWSKHFGKLIEPIIKILVKLKISPNLISYFSAFLGLAATAFLWVDLSISGILLISSTLIDTLDGALARYLNKVKLRGAITDCFTDQITLSAITFGLILTGIITPLFGCLFLLLYPILIIFSVLKNILKIPSRYTFRPRLLIYGAFLFYIFTSINFFNFILGPLVLILGCQVIRDFYQLRNYLDEEAKQ